VPGGGDVGEDKRWFALARRCEVVMGKDDVPRFVYHYTKRETVIERILPSREIQLGSVSTTNDPRETQTWGNVFFGPMEAVRRFEPFSVNPALDACRRLDWWLLCACCDHADLKSATINEVDRNHFKHGYARARMWAQYAQNHQGVCLVFERDALDEALRKKFGVENVFSGRVQYDDVKGQESIPLDVSTIERDGMESALRKHVADNHAHYFLSKNLDWEAESEYRWAIYRRRDEGGQPRVDISRALRSVILGFDFPKVYGPSIRHLCESAGVTIEKMNWWNRVPRKEPWVPSS
jgi:hypothetical protein